MTFDKMPTADSPISMPVKVGPPLIRLLLGPYLLYVYAEDASGVIHEPEGVRRSDERRSPLLGTTRYDVNRIRVSSVFDFVSRRG